MTTNDEALEALDEAVHLYDDSSTDPCLCGTWDGEISCPRCTKATRARTILDTTIRAALEQREPRVVTAKPIQWKHHTYRNGAQEWRDDTYGFTIEFDSEESPEYRYAAVWGEEAEDLPTLEGAQPWCQEQTDSLVKEWAVLAAAPSPGGNDGSE